MNDCVGRCGINAKSISGQSEKPHPLGFRPHQNGLSAWPRVGFVFFLYKGGFRVTPPKHGGIKVVAGKTSKHQFSHSNKWV